MSRIQSSVGLITGLPIQQTVDQLMAIAATPRNLLIGRTNGIQSEQVAIKTLSTLVLGLQFEVNKLNSTSLFESRSVTSSNSDVLSASLAENGAPTVGTYAFTPVRTASAHQLLSSRFGGASTLSGVNAFSFRTGGFIDQGVSLSALNAGDGVERGEIRITDRSGANAVIDLRFARSVDDVLKAINSNSTINVTVVADGDAFKLIDNTGQNTSNLIVEELNGGATAATLGLAGINVAAAEATGDDVLALHAGTKLAALNDGNGTHFRDGDDLEITLRNGESLSIDLSGATTLGQVLARLNAAGPESLSAAISGDGNRLVVTDLTAGAEEFSISSALNGSAAEDLGLSDAAVDGVVSGRRLQAGLKTSLLSSLNGGAGLSQLGALTLSDRSGKSATINLSQAETIDDVLAAINSASVDIQATINGSRNGILLTDTSGSTAQNLSVGNGDATNTANSLGIAINAAKGAVDSGSLDRQTFSESTLLSSLNDGDGIDADSFKILDSSGKEAAVILDKVGSEITTVGGLIDAINALSNISVEARINDTGDGLLLIDTAGGAGALTVKEVGNHTTAADLGLLSAVKTVDVDGFERQVVDSTRIRTVEVAHAISLSALNGGGGVDLGKFTITDSAGGLSTIDLETLGNDATIGELLDTINAGNARVEARINETGDGILLIDTAGGAGTLSVAETGGGSAAGDLGLLGDGGALTVGGETVHGIDGGGAFDTSSVDSDALARVVAEINGLGVGVAATTFFDGDGYRLSLAAERTGEGHALLVDTSRAGYSFKQTSAARDALLLFGTPEDVAAGILTASSSNEFQGVVDGVNLTISEGSLEPVIIEVEASDDDLISTVKKFVSAYNSLRKNLDTVTAFDEEALTTGVLFGSNAALRVDTELSRLVTDRFFGVGKFESLEEIGVSVNDVGKLSLDESKLSEAFQTDAKALKTLFSDEANGIVAKFGAVIDQIAGEDNSLLSTRNDVLKGKIDTNNRRIDGMNATLTKQRDRLLLTFYRMEEAIGKMQADLAVIQNFQAIPPLTFGGAAG